MSWLMLASDYGADPRVQALSPGARLLLVELACYCDRRLTDGRFTIEAVASVAAECRLQAPSELLEELLQVSPITDTPLVEKAMVGWQLVDYLDRSRYSIFHQRSRDEVTSDRARDLAKKHVRRGKGPVSPGNNRRDSKGDNAGDKSGDNRGESRGDLTRALPGSGSTRTPYLDVSTSRTPEPQSRPRRVRAREEMPVRDLDKRTDQPSLLSDLLGDVVSQVTGRREATK